MKFTAFIIVFVLFFSSISYAADDTAEPYSKEEFPESNSNTHPLAVRENTLKKLFEKGNYTDKYIKKTVQQNKGYANLPATSPGFEDL